MLKKLTVSFILSLSFFSFSYADENSADCLILEDENSIICKYTLNRVDFEKNIQVQWIEPDGKITRQRDLTIPMYHGSIYDYRYLEARTKGTWTFKVIDDKKEYTTNFIVE